MDALTLDIIQCAALIIVPLMTYRAGKREGFHNGTLATLNYLEDQGIVKFEEPTEQSK